MGRMDCFFRFSVLAAEVVEEASLSRQNPDMFDSAFLSIRQIPSQPELKITDYELKITNVVNSEWLIENPQP